MIILAITLPKDVVYTFTVPTDSEVTVMVTEGGPVDYSESLAGPFGDPAGTLALGESETFTRPMTLKADADSELEFSYPVEEPPEPEPPPERTGKSS